MSPKSENGPISLTRIFLVLTGTIAFVVDFYTLIQIITQIRLPSSINIHLPVLPRIHIPINSTYSMQTKDVTLLLLIYAFIALCIWGYLAVSKALNIIDYSDIGWRSGIKWRDSDQDYLIALRMAIGFNSILLLVSLWNFAFNSVFNFSIYLFLGKVWLLTLIVLLIFVNLESIIYVIGMLTMVIPLWTFLEKNSLRSSWWIAILSVLPVLLVTTIYMSVLVILGALFVRWYLRLIAFSTGYRLE